MPLDTINDEIKQHEGLIYYTLKYLKCGYSHDYISVGYEALWRAIQTFDENNGAEFSTYAVTCIKHAIYNVFREQKAVNDHEVLLEDLIETSTGIRLNVSTSMHPEVQHAVDEALNYFTGKKHQILKCWIESSMSATAIADEVGCSQSYVSQVLKEIQAFLRKDLINAGYSPRT